MSAGKTNHESELAAVTRKAGWSERAVFELARGIWRETYRHDTLMEWHEIKKGTLHYRRTMNAARAAIGETLKAATAKAVDDQNLTTESSR